MAAAVAIASALAVLWAPPSHAMGACTQLANNPGTVMQYKPCVNNMGGWCRWLGVGILGGLGGGTTHMTCFYPDNSRDECDINGTAWTHQWDTHCDWFAADV